MAKKTKPDAPPEQVKREVTRSSSFFSIYANDIQAQTSPWDVRLTFGEFEIDGPTQQDVTMKVEMLGQVRLSPQIAKRLLKILATQIGQYEERFGLIPEPKE